MHAMPSKIMIAAILYFTILGVAAFVVKPSITYVQVKGSFLLCVLVIRGRRVTATAKAKATATAASSAFKALVRHTCLLPQLLQKPLH